MRAEKTRRKETPVNVQKEDRGRVSPLPRLEFERKKERRTGHDKKEDLAP